MARSLPRPHRMDKAGRRADSPAMEWRERWYPPGRSPPWRDGGDPRGLHRGTGPACRRGARWRLPQDGADPSARRAARRDVARAAVRAYRQFPGWSRGPAARPMSWTTASRWRGWARSVRSCPSACRNVHPTPPPPPPPPPPALYARSLALLDGLGAERWGGCLPRLGNGAAIGNGVRPVARDLRRDGRHGGVDLRLAAHGPGGLAARGGGLVRPSAAFAAMSGRCSVAKRRRSFRRRCGRRVTSLSEHLAPSLGDRPPARGAASALST